MKIHKHKSLTMNVSSDNGEQIASLHADVRAGRGVAMSCDVFDAQATADESEAFEAAKAAFRAEVEALAESEGAVMI